MCLLYALWVKSQKSSHRGEEQNLLNQIQKKTRIERTECVCVCFFSQLRQFIHWCVELEVWREEISSTWVDETVRLADGDIGYSGYISDFCTGGK